MSLKKILRARIFQEFRSPNFPVGEFMRWAFGLGLPRTQLLKELDHLKEQLDIEAEALRDQIYKDSILATQHEYWCFYCAQVRAYLRMLLKQASRFH